MASRRHAAGAGGVKRIYASIAGTGVFVSNVANVLVPMDGHIVGVQWAVRLNAAPAARVVADLELSYSGVFAGGVNDAPQAISTYSQAFEFTTSGMAVGFVPQFTVIPSLMIMGGTLLYLHALVTNAITVLAFCSVYIDFPTMLVPSPLR